MKLLLTAEQLGRRVPGGIGTYVRGLVKGLSQHDVRPTLLVGRGDENTVVGLAGDRLAAKLSTRLLTKAWDLGLAAPRGDFEVLHATSMSMPKTNAPTTVMIHDLAWQSHPEAFTRRGRRWHEAALQHAIRHADVMFVPSAQTENALRDAGVARDRLRLVPHGHDHLMEADHEKLDEKLLRLGVSVASKFLLTVGTLEPRKNLLRLVEAYARVKHEFAEPMPLLIVGRVGWGREITPESGVIVVNDADDGELVALYERCTAMLYVPLLEGYGFPVIEAMSVGAPVVATAVPSAGDAALQVDALNTVAIGEAILRIANDVELRNDLSHRGRIHAAHNTWKASARKHIDVWNELS